MRSTKYYKNRNDLVRLVKGKWNMTRLIYVNILSKYILITNCSEVDESSLTKNNVYVLKSIQLVRNRNGEIAIG